MPQNTEHLMLAAHMDEVGLMTKYVDERGFIHFTKTGGWFDQTLLNQRMILHTEKGKIYGVIGSKPPHVMKEEDLKKPVKADEMFIDVGATSKEDAEKIGVMAGTPMTPDMEFKPLGNDRVTGKAFDNRAGCVMLIEALRQMKDVKATVHAVFTVQEEVGLKGAKTSAFGLNPDVAVATDVTITGDHPGIEKKDSAAISSLISPLRNIICPSSRREYRSIWRGPCGVCSDTKSMFGIPIVLSSLMFT